MENLYDLLQKDLDAGFSKSDLERLIGLSKNSLSGILAGNRSLSKKNTLRVKLFMESEKPSPLELTKKEIKVPVKNTKKQTNLIKPVPPVYKESSTINTISKKEMPAGLTRLAQMRWIRENN